jgi:hypothetical protein
VELLFRAPSSWGSAARKQKCHSRCGEEESLASLWDRLIGAWRLAEFTVTAEDGTVTYPMGEDVEGLIIYTPDGTCPLS